MTITETTKQLLEPADIKAKIDQFGPHAWVEALKSPTYTHHQGTLGAWPQVGTQLPISACCLGVLACAAGVAGNQPTDPKQGRPRIDIEWGYEELDADGYQDEGSSDTDLESPIRPWWLGMEVPLTSDELVEFHPCFAYQRELDTSMPPDVMTALILINDWDGHAPASWNKSAPTVDYSKQIEFIEKFIIPAYDANQAKHGGAA